MKKMFAVVAMCVTMGGCAGWPVFKDCMKGQKVADEQAMGEAVIALASGSSYMDDLLKLGAKVGLPALDCVAQALYADVKSNAALAALADHLKSYLASRSASGATFKCEGPRLASISR